MSEDMIGQEVCWSGPRTLPIPPTNAEPGILHALLADLGIQGVTRQGGKTWVTFPAAPKLSIAKEIVRRVRSLPQ